MNFKNFEIVEVSKDEIGRYAKLSVHLPDGSVVIRWDVDSLMFQRMKKIVSEKCFDSLATDYRYELVPICGAFVEKKGGPTTYFGHIRCIQGHRVQRIEMICTERFAGNMEWFRQQVRTVEDIKHLEWG